jgi:16S rRNA (guanine966-N2)-methyltransferase
MRVISGTAKGRPLKAPASMSTRPMADRVKESLFNILAVMDYPREGDRVLDLYAGTGSLGIEALSRGAAWADFVDQGHAPGRCILDNLQSTGLAGQGKVHQMPVAGFLHRHAAANLTINELSAHNKTRYDIIFCDPPYADPTIPALLAELAAWDGLDAEGILVFGHATQVALPDSVGRLARVRFRKWGGSAFSLYKSAAGPGIEAVLPDVGHSEEED